METTKNTTPCKCSNSSTLSERTPFKAPAISQYTTYCLQVVNLEYTNAKFHIDHTLIFLIIEPGRKGRKKKCKNYQLKELRVTNTWVDTEKKNKKDRKNLSNYCGVSMLG